MIQLSDREQKFIESYMYLIDQNNFEAFYNLAGQDLVVMSIHKLTRLFLEAEIYPLEYMESVPEYYSCFDDALDKVILPDHIKDISRAAFTASSISSIKLSQNLQYIGSGAFSACTSLKGAIYLPDKLKTVGEGAFQESNIGSVSLPQEIKYIDANAFADCYRLTSVKYRGTVRQFQHVRISPTAFNHSGYLDFIECIDGTIPLNDIQ